MSIFLEEDLRAGYNRASRQPTSLYEMVPFEGRDRQSLLDAVRIICHHPLYYAAALPVFDELWVTAWATGHMVVDDAVAFTWLRKDGGVLSETPAEADFRRESGDLWVVDFVRLPSAPVAAAVRRVHNALLDHEIACEGELVHIWRHRSRRYGTFRVRRQPYERALRQQEGEAGDH